MDKPWYYWLNQKQYKTHFAPNKNKPGRSQEHIEAIKEDMEREFKQEN